MAWWSKKQLPESPEPAKPLESQGLPEPQEPPKPRAREKKSAVLGSSDTLGKFLILGAGAAGTTPSSAKSLYNQSTAVSIPINMVAEPFSTVRLALMIKDKLVTDHPVLTFLKKPSPFFSQELFLEVISKDFLITGEFAVVAGGNVNRPPLWLQPVGPEMLTPVRDSSSDAAASWIISGNTLTGTYKANLNNLNFRYLDGNLRELKVVRDYSPRDNSLLRGQSLLVSASKEARQSILGTQHNVSLLENGGRISLVFHFEEDMEPEDFEAIRETVVNRYSGVLEAGSVGVTAGGKLQIEELGKSPKDMDFVNLQSFVIKSMGLVYHIPIPLLSDQRQTLNNYTTGVVALYDDAVIPMSRRVLGGLSDLLLPRWDMDPREAWIIVHPDSVTTLVQRRNEELLKRKQIGIETINELRAFVGREPVEGGDNVLVAANMVPVGTDIFTDDNQPDRLEPTLGGASDPPGTRTPDPPGPEPDEPDGPEDE